MLKVKGEAGALVGKGVGIKQSRQETFQKVWIAWDSDWDEHVWDQLTIVYAQAQAQSWFFPMQHGLCMHKSQLCSHMGLHPTKGIDIKVDINKLFWWFCNYFTFSDVT